MAALQGKFYSHQAVDKDLTYCPPPQKLSTSGAAAPTGPRRLGGPQKSRTLASRTDTVVCEPPRRLGTGGAPSSAPAPIVAASSREELAAVAKAPATAPAEAPAAASDPAASADVAAALFGRGGKAAIPEAAKAQAQAAALLDGMAKAREEAFAKSEADAAEKARTPPPPPKDQVEEAAYIDSWLGLSQPTATRLLPPHDVETSPSEVVVTVGPLEGVSSAAELDLTVDATTLTLAGAALPRSMVIALPCAVAPGGVRAKFKKREKKLRVTLARPGF